MRTAAAQHGRRRPGRRIGRGIALGVVATLAFGAGAAAAAYLSLDDNIDDAGDVTAMLGDRPSPSATPSAPGDVHVGSAVNVLILGSDDRSGANAAIGGANDGMHSDTTIVAHISADRSRVELVSIPRDLVIDRPTCVTRDGTEIPGKSQDMFNDAFSVGWNHSQDLATAAACTWRTVETITGLRLDGFVLLDFVGLTAMVDAIGGIPICLPEAYDDASTGLHVPAGPQVFDGTTAVQFARAREDLGDGSDTQRILRQHDLMGAMSASLLSAQTLADPVALFSFARAATSSLTASEGFSSLADLTGLGLSLRHVGADHVVFLSMPTAVSPKDRNRLVWAPEADTLWARLAADQPVGEVAPSPPVESGGPASSPAATVPPVVDPPWTPSNGVTTSADAATTCT